MIPMPIIVGAPRSGTTLLRFMLDAHPEVAIPPETGFLTIGGDFAAQDDELREAFFGAVTRYPSDMPAWEDFGIPGEVFRAALSGIEPFTVVEGYRAFYRLYAARFGKPRGGARAAPRARHAPPRRRNGRPHRRRTPAAAARNAPAAGSRSRGGLEIVDVRRRTGAVRRRRGWSARGTGLRTPAAMTRLRWGL